MIVTEKDLSRAALQAWRTMEPTFLLATNTKLDKATDATSGYLLAGLTLAPHSLALRTPKLTLCDHASKGCRQACQQWFAGQRVQSNARDRALYNSAYYLLDREAFLDHLRHEIRLWVRKARRVGAILLVRLNMASDVDWTSLIEEFPDVLFFDYTKNIPRFRRYLAGDLPPNYFLTFSASEATRPDMWAEFLRAGGNVAAVFDVLYQSGGRYKPWQKGALAETVAWGGGEFPVVDGDLHDVRLPQVDGRGVVVGLRLKGKLSAKSRARKSGFALAGDGTQVLDRSRVALAS